FLCFAVRYHRALHSFPTRRSSDLESIAHCTLVALERVHRGLEILRDEILHRVAVQADQLLEEVERQHGRAARFLVDDDLRQHLADRKSTRLNSSHSQISYAVFCLK